MISKKVLILELAVNKVIPVLKGNNDVNKLPRHGPVTSDVLIVCVNDTPFFINLLIISLFKIGSN